MTWRVPSPSLALRLAKRLRSRADLFGDGVGIVVLLRDAARALEGLAHPKQAAPAEPLYLVWSNEHRAWWDAEERGYTRIIERAGRYTRAAALTIASRRGGGWQTESNPYEIAIPEADAIAQYVGVAA
ncbi:hypothetical protein [uncultured Sphingomonas sp.]|uniref:hypothetical protein n=1 Tax=uncultured Sphingomonas sp. TaxID=158754 RepID=UPI0025E092A4|nr:hypothetical protein [uncultured Sphingomonas sp.]